MNKRIWLVFILTLGILVYYFVDSYALLESNAEASVDKSLGKWEIYLNDIDVTTITELTLNDLVYEENDNVEEGYFAPGSVGTYEILINPGETDVAIRYDITVDLDDLEEHSNINFEVLNSNLNLNTTNSNSLTYSGVITLEEIQEGLTKNLDIKLTWINDETYNENDSALMVINASFKIPLTINFSQYMGETL